MAQIVYTGTGGTDAAVSGTLFQGQRFWISQRVPSRNHFVQQVAVNGGKLVNLERDADIKIVDHARKEVIPGSYSWTYIDQSVRKGVLESLADHQAGPPSGTVRSVGSLNQLTKGSRTPFTAEDDHTLYAWVQECEQQGMKVAGNEIYKQLELKNPRHTFQSWRDRYLKYLSLKPHLVQVPVNSPPILPLDQRLPKKTHHEKQHRKPSPNGFDEEDEQTILDRASDIENIDPDVSTVAWQAWSKEYPHHSAEEWQEFWEKHIRPRYLQKARDQSSGTKRKLEELLDAQLGHELDDQRRTSSQSEITNRPSCRLKSHDELSSDYVERRADLNVSRPSSDIDNVQPIPSIETISHSILPSEPEKITYKTEIPSSSPPQSVAAVKTSTRSHTYRNPFTDPEDLSSETDSIEELKGPSTPVKRVVYGQQDNEFNGIGNSVIEVQGSPSLSEPDRHQTHIETRRNKPYEDLGLDVPSPEGGWNFDEEQNEEVTIGEEESGSRHATAEDTQDLLNAKTQIPDFSVPDPDGGWDAALPSSPLPMTTLLQTASDPGTNVVDEIDEEEANAQFMEWITDHLTADVPVEDVEVALKSTGNNLDLADIVLESLAENCGVPQNLRGVWTIDDDDNLYARDGRKIEQLQRKHGMTEFDERYKFLAKYERRL